jgi:hypothetical protein
MLVYGIIKDNRCAARLVVEDSDGIIYYNIVHVQVISGFRHDTYSVTCIPFCVAEEEADRETLRCFFCLSWVSLPLIFIITSQVQFCADLNLNLKSLCNITQVKHYEANR